MAVDGSDTELSMWQLLMISSSDLNLFSTPKSKANWPLSRKHPLPSYYHEQGKGRLPLYKDVFNGVFLFVFLLLF